MGMKQIKGITDEVSTCDCCGRTDLKKTIILSEDGCVSFFGSECAARALGRRRKVNVEKAAVKAQGEVDQREATRKFYADFLADDKKLKDAFDHAIGFTGSFRQFVEKIQADAAAFA